MNHERIQCLPGQASLFGLRLLCLLVPSRTGKARSLPIHTLHRVPPYAGLHGRYYDGAGRWSVAIDPLDVPGGTGFYLRKTHAALRPPKYWHVVYDSGRRTPFVPVHEPFELED